MDASTSAHDSTVRTSDKMSRWERITRNQMRQVDKQTAEMRRLLERDFVNQRQQRQMNGTTDGGTKIDPSPALVMEMRHAMVRSNRRNKTQHADDLTIRNIRMDRLREHNSTVEQRFHEHELNKFKYSMVLKAKTKPMLSSVVVKLDNYTTLVDGNELDEIDSGRSQCQETNAFDCADTNSILTTDDGISEDFPPTVPSADYYEHALDVIDPFDEQDIIHSNRSVISFENYVQITDYKSDPTLAASFDSVDDAKEDVSKIEFVPKHTSNVEPLRLVGNRLNVSVLHAEQQSNNSNSDGIESVSPQPPERCQIIAELCRPQPSATIDSSGLDRRALLLRYFRRWTHYVTVEKMATLSRGERLQRNESRAHMIEQYLRTIRHEHAKKTIVQRGNDDVGGTADTDGLEDGSGRTETETERDSSKRAKMSGFAAGFMVKKFSTK